MPKCQILEFTPTEQIQTNLTHQEILKIEAHSIDLYSNLNRFKSCKIVIHWLRTKSRGLLKRSKNLVSNNNIQKLNNILGFRKIKYQDQEMFLSKDSSSEERWRDYIKMKADKTKSNRSSINQPRLILITFKDYTKREYSNTKLINSK